MPKTPDTSEATNPLGLAIDKLLEIAETKPNLRLVDLTKDVAPGDVILMESNSPIRGHLVYAFSVDEPAHYDPNYHSRDHIAASAGSIQFRDLGGGRLPYNNGNPLSTDKKVHLIGSEGKPKDNYPFYPARPFYPHKIKWGMSILFQIPLEVPDYLGQTTAKIHVPNIISIKKIEAAVLTT